LVTGGGGAGSDSGKGALGCTFFVAAPGDPGPALFDGLFDGSASDAPGAEGAADFVWSLLATGAAAGVAALAGPDSGGVERVTSLAGAVEDAGAEASDFGAVTDATRSRPSPTNSIR